MTQSELAEIIRDAFDGVIWQKTGNVEPMGSTNTYKFEQALKKANWHKFICADIEPEKTLEYATNDPRLE